MGGMDSVETWSISLIRLIFMGLVFFNAWQMSLFRPPHPYIFSHIASGCLAER